MNEVSVTVNVCVKNCQKAKFQIICRKSVYGVN